MSGPPVPSPSSTAEPNSRFTGRNGIDVHFHVAVSRIAAFAGYWWRLVISTLATRSPAVVSGMTNMWG